VWNHLRHDGSTSSYPGGDTLTSPADCVGNFNTFFFTCARVRVTIKYHTNYLNILRYVFIRIIWFTYWFLFINCLSIYQLNHLIYFLHFSNIFIIYSNCHKKEGGVQVVF
jgi:hypothetical protein